MVSLESTGSEGKKIWFPLFYRKYGGKESCSPSGRKQTGHILLNSAEYFYKPKALAGSLSGGQEGRQLEARSTVGSVDKNARTLGVTEGFPVRASLL